jgi:hypothetical protein
MTDFLLSFLPAAGAILFVLSAVSLFFKSEAIRGGGRVICGAAGVFVGGFFWVLTAYTPVWATLLNGHSPVPIVSAPGWVAAAFIISGLVTIGCGVRKFGRRNLPSTD